MNTPAENNSFIEHPYLYPNQQDSLGSIPVPSSYRIIGTMNSFDKNQLYPLSSALKRRSKIVKIGMPNIDNELSVIIEKVSEKLSRDKFSAGTKGIISQAASHLSPTIKMIRKISSLQPIVIYEKCNIATAQFIDICLFLSKYLFSQSKINETNLKVGSDKSFSKMYLDAVSQFNTHILDKLSNNVFTAKDFPECFSKITEQLDLFSGY